MAMPYPEGEVFFDRRILKSSAYQADSPEDFYSHFMIEYVWNIEAYHGSKNANYPQGRKHPRSGYKIVTADWWGTYYGNWTQLPVSYGPSPGDIKRRVEHNLCTWGNRFRDYEKGGSAEPWFMTVPMPTKKERWVWIDMLSYVRAIYIPVAHSASKDYPHLSTWVQVNFCFDRDVSIWRGADHFLNHKCNKLKGLNMWANSAVGLDIPGLVALLTVPRQFRKVNPYTARLIRIVPTESIKTVGVTKTLKDSNDFSWKDIQSAHSGLDLMWKKPEKSTWFEDFTKNATTFAIGFIPVAGPFLAIAFNLTWSALRDEDQFWNDLKLWAPGIKLAEEFKIDFREGIAEIRLFVDDAWLTSQTGSLPGKINGKPSNVEENDFKNAEKVIESSATEDVNTGAEDPKIKEGVLIEIAAEA